MKLAKTERGSLPAKENFSFTGKKVQGAEIGMFGSARYVISPRRFKTVCDDTLAVHILQGNGHFKWARGEMPFSAGESFLAENIGEFEINGNSEFLLLRPEN